MFQGGCVLVLVCSLPSARQQHLSYGDCLEVKREYYQNCCVLDCVTQCTRWNRRIELVTTVALRCLMLKGWRSSRLHVPCRQRTSTPCRRATQVQRWPVPLRPVHAHRLHRNTACRRFSAQTHRLLNFRLARCHPSKSVDSYSFLALLCLRDYTVSEKRHWCCTLWLQRISTDIGNFWQRSCWESMLSIGGLLSHIS